MDPFFEQINTVHTKKNLSMYFVSKVIGQSVFYYSLYKKTHPGSITPASNLGYLAPPPGQFFMGAKLFIGTPWMGNEGVLKKNLVWAM